MPLRPLLLPTLLLLITAAAACTQPQDQPAPPTETPAQPDAAPPQTQSRQPAQNRQPAPDQQNDAQPNQQTSTPEPETSPQAPSPPADSDDLPLAPQPYDHDFALSIARHLATEIGPRPAGQPAETQAAEYLARTFRELGYDAQIIPFTGTIRSPWFARFGANRPVVGLLAQGAAHAPASGPLVLVDGIGTPEEIAAANPDGAILVVDRGRITFGRKALNAQAAGAAGLIVINREDRPIIALIEEDGIDIPVVIVPSSARDDLAPAAGRTASLAPQPTGDPSAQSNTVDSANVLAAWPDGDCRILIGGHYDSVPVAPGGNDNASGTAVAAALARAFAATAAATGLCFAAFGAEELGLLGSDALVDHLRQNDRLDRIAAMINLDAIGGGDRPIQLVGSAGLAAIADRLADRLGIAVQDSSAAPSPASDHLPFEQRGIPVLAFFAPNPIIHVPTDTYDNLDSALMNDIARLAHAAIACIAADLQIPIQTPLPCESN